MRLRLRPYLHSIDFDIIKNWITDERTHALWCAGRFPYPLEYDSFRQSLDDMAIRNGDAPFTATDDDGKPIGFFCLSVDCASDEAMLKFVVIDSSRRGERYGRMMITQILRYAFLLSEVKAVILNVFSVNEAARHCYLRAGFQVRSETPDAFQFKDESWGRCNMIKTRRGE